MICCSEYRFLFIWNLLLLFCQKIPLPVGIILGDGYRASVYRLVGTLLVNTDEDWRAGRRYMGKEGINKIFRRFLEKQNKDFILEEAIIKLEVQNSIYTT